MFQKAKSIWIKDKSTEMNVFAAFHVQKTLTKPANLHVTAATYYRVFVNGEFIAYGPARTARGYAREDILTVCPDENGICDIIVQVCGYYNSGLSIICQPSFVMAELECDGEVLAYTGHDFEGYMPACKLQKVERYSMQRNFTEIWDYRTCDSLTDDAYKAETEVLDLGIKVIDRVAPYPLYEDVKVPFARTKGVLEFDETLPYKAEKYSGGGIPKVFGKFEYDEIELHPHTWIQRQRQTITQKEVAFPLELKKGEYAILDFGRIECGFFNLHMEALEESDVVMAFTEYYEGETFELPNMNAHNVIEYFLPEHADRTELSFEPYTCRFAIIAAKEGHIKLHGFGMKTFMFDISDVTYPDYKDDVLNGIYYAAVRTFAHNAVDIYMDCPSRERAGWLCDSYFTGKTEYALTGKTGVEDAFLENYRLFDGDSRIPDGMIPMCYPSEIEVGGKFIPQWSMWYILESADYMLKRGHKDMAEDFRKSIYDLLNFYKQYENEDGLLERLPSWNFVEWSKANDWTWDVNYPTNFLYAQVLESIADVYGDEECRRRCVEVRKKTIEQSFNGTYFLDHAVRNDEGVLCRQEDCSEAGQYYAVLFGDIDLNSEKFQPLKKLITDVFAPDRKGVMPEIMEVNAFIGAYLRLEALLKMGEYELLLKDLVGFFGNMSKHTGTLWEYRQFKGSDDHGFASYALVAMRTAMEALHK